MAAVIFGGHHCAMARLSFHSFFARWSGLQRRPAGHRAVDEPAPAEPASGCGWFDSSLELRQGVDVVEVPASTGWHDTEPAAWAPG